MKRPRTRLTLRTRTLRLAESFEREAKKLETKFHEDTKDLKAKWTCAASTLYVQHAYKLRAIAESLPL